MNIHPRQWPNVVVGIAILWIMFTVSCSTPSGGQPPELPTLSAAAAAAPSFAKSLTEMLGEASDGVGRISAAKDIPGERRYFLFEERHTSVAGQLETAIMMVRLYERFGLRHIALEGLTTDKQFPATQWFKEMGGPQDEDLRNQIAVGLVRQGEISAAELMALACPDAVVHSADDPVAYAVEMTKGAGTASIPYLYKIGFKSVGPAHYQRLQQLNQQKRIKELLEYVIALDPWAKQQYDQLNQVESVSIEQMLRRMREIEQRASAAGAEITSEERNAMSEAKAFFEAAGKRTETMIDVALRTGRSSSLVALNIGAAHTEGAEQLLDKAKVAYGVLTPLSLANKLKNGELSYDAFERKSKLLSVAWAGKGIGSLLDDRRKPPPVVGKPWFQSLSQLRFATAIIAREAQSPGFPDSNLKTKLNALSRVKVNWETLKGGAEGATLFQISVTGETRSSNVWVKCGTPKNMALYKNTRRTLEEMLLESLGEVRKETGPRAEPPKGPVLEIVTPDVSAAFAEEPQALTAVRVSG